MSATFSTAMQAALDRYDVPALPDGFADRLTARATAEAMVERKAAPRQRTSSPWRRASRIIGSIGAVGFLSATAAAMGAFGDPLEIPIISEVAREFNLVEESTAVRHAIVATSKAVASPPNEIIKEPTMVEADDKARQTLNGIVEHPRFDGLAPRQKRVILRRASQRLVRSGEASRENVKSALLDIRKERSAVNQASRPQSNAIDNILKRRIQNATPEQREILQDRIKALPANRQQVVVERLGLGDAAAGAGPAVEPFGTDSIPAIEAESPPSPPANIGTPSDSLPVTSAVREQRLDQLKARLGEITPEQRAARREQLQQRPKQNIRSRQLRDKRAKLRRRRN
ncbi:MAG: hypothetical protein WBM39_04065 [Parasphingorhabdus sp.]